MKEAGDNTKEIVGVVVEKAIAGARSPGDQTVEATMIEALFLETSRKIAIRSGKVAKDAFKKEKRNNK